MTTLSTAARNAAADAVVDLLDGGTLEILTSGDTLIIEVDLPTPAFGDAASGVATANSMATATVGAGVSSQTAAKAQIKNSGGTVVVSGLTCTQSGGGGDVIMSDLVYSTDSQLSVTSLTYTQPAS